MVFIFSQILWNPSLTYSKHIHTSTVKTGYRWNSQSDFYVRQIWTYNGMNSTITNIHSMHPHLCTHTTNTTCLKMWLNFLFDLQHFIMLYDYVNYGCVCSYTCIPDAVWHNFGKGYLCLSLFWNSFDTINSSFFQSAKWMITLKNSHLFQKVQLVQTFLIIKSLGLAEHTTVQCIFTRWNSAHMQ